MTNENTKASYRLEGREVPEDHARSPKVQAYIDNSDSPPEWDRPLTPEKIAWLQRKFKTLVLRRPGLAQPVDWWDYDA